MKTLFIPAISKQKLNKKNLSQIAKLPKDIALCYSIQYKEIAKEVKEILSKKHNILSFSQVLGCSQLKLSKKTKAILLITDGKFHAIGLAYESKLPVYIFNNFKLQQISKQDISKFEKNQKARYLRYLHADKIGILVSTKHGQQNLKKALQFKETCKKQANIFLSNNIDTAEFENFPEIQFWVNTACRRMDLNSNSIINIDQIK